MVTLTAVRPPARFGVIKISGKVVKFFREKVLWIQAGLMAVFL